MTAVWGKGDNLLSVCIIAGQNNLVSPHIKNKKYLLKMYSIHASGFLCVVIQRESFCAFACGSVIKAQLHT